MTPQHLNGALNAYPRMSAFQPLDTSRQVTNKQLADAINKTHECVHALAREVREDREQARDRDRKHDIAIARIQGKLGIEEGDTPGKPGLAGVKPWKALLWVIAAMSGVQLTYQILVPSVIEFALAIHQRLMGG